MSSSAWPRALAPLLVALTAAAAPVLPPSKKDIAEWVRQLGGRDFAGRERAQRRLWEAGAAAEEALQEAARGSDPEVRRRAGEVLAKFQWGVYPATPKRVVELIGQYQSSDDAGKVAAVKKLFDEGGAGCAALLKIVAAETNPQAKRNLSLTISREAGRAVPPLLADKNYAALDTLLELTVEGDDSTLPNYAAYHLLRGQLDARIAHFRKRAEASSNPAKEREILLYLYRAKGDTAAAIREAERANVPDLVAGLLEESGRWRELAGRADAGDRDGAERLGYRAAYHRLAGNGKEFDAAVAELRKYPEGKPPGDTASWEAAKALLLNDRPADALELLGKENAVKKVEILAAQMRFAEALRVAEKAREDGPRGPLLDLQRARLLYFLGEKEPARKLFAALMEQHDLSWSDDLVGWEARLGLEEDAFAHCARALRTTSNDLLQRRLLAKVLPGQEEMAQVWWTVLRAKQASEPAGVTMTSLRQLLGGTIKGKELDGLVGLAETQAAGQPPEEQGRWLQAVGEVLLTAGEEERARRTLERAADAGPSPGPLVVWGDRLAGRGQWAKAAGAYHAAWTRDRRQPLALFLRGRALAEAGRKAEGEALMEQSHWLPLGDDVLRLEFARQLAARGHPRASRRERDLLLRTCPVRSFQTGEARRLDAIDALKEKDYLRAADLQQRVSLRVLRAHVYFVETAAYVGVPWSAHRLRAQGLVAAGKLDEANKEIEHCLGVLPANPDLALALVPELERRGHQKEADALFGRVRAVKAKLCKDYPRSAGLHNSLAWLCAACRRDLENAQKYAEKAVGLEPKVPGFRDTLAEVLFQRGQKDRAIAEMRKCIEQSPSRAYFRRQLKRFEAGDPKADIPGDGPEPGP